MSIGLVYTFEPTLPTFALAEGTLFNRYLTRYIHCHSILVQAAALALACGVILGDRNPPNFTCVLGNGTVG